MTTLKSTAPKSQTLRESNSVGGEAMYVYSPSLGGQLAGPTESLAYTAHVTTGAPMGFWVARLYCRIKLPLAC